MSPALPFDVIAVIIDIVGENKDTNLLKELALVSHSFHQICSNHLFATVELHNTIPDSSYRLASKKGFVKLLKSRPDVVKYIRKLTYTVGFYMNDDDHLLSPVLLNFLPTISRLNCLTLNQVFWNRVDSSLTSAFLHLMHLPTMNHINLSLIQGFPLSSLTQSVNLHRLHIFNLDPFTAGGYPETVVQLEMMPKIREFHTSRSAMLTTKLLHAERQDGQPAFNFMDLRRFSACFNYEQNIRYVLQNAKLLESLHFSVGRGRSLHDILSLSARTLKVLDLTVPLYDDTFPVPLPLAGLCGELEAMAGHNMLETLSLEVEMDIAVTEDFIGSIIQKVEKVLVKPGWSALRQVSFKLSLKNWVDNSANLCEALQSLPDKYLSHLSKLESVAFDYSAYVLSSEGLKVFCN
jgi:hypothetical protein